MKCGLWEIRFVITGFDDLGRQFDLNGNLVDWWQSETKAHYLDKVNCIIEQYGNFTEPKLKMKVSLVWNALFQDVNSVIIYSIDNFIYSLGQWQIVTRWKHCWQWWHEERLSCLQEMGWAQPRGASIARPTELHGWTNILDCCGADVVLSQPRLVHKDGNHCWYTRAQPLPGHWFRAE